MAHLSMVWDGAALVLLVLLLVTPGSHGAKVTYDGRSLMIDGQRVLVLSGAFHYTRADPSMYGAIMDAMKAGGLNAVETYVFWNQIEAQQGVFDTQLLRTFVKTAADHGLYVILRIGPYVCAEWNYGGFPEWLKEVPNIVFRTDNAPFKAYMERLVRMVTGPAGVGDYFIDKNLGGTIIAAQIENEYSGTEKAYGDAGRRYALWCVNLTRTLPTTVPWIMCQQDDMPDGVINTVNGHYGDNWLPTHFATFPNQPAFYTELWVAWFNDWGDGFATRPPEDLAFAVARWFARGGSLVNYYMYYGGTNFGRTAGGPGITTCYDYDAPIAENGRIHEPQYSHLANQHAVLQAHAAAILGNPVATTEALGPKQEALRYGRGAGSIVFMCNIDSGDSPATVTYEGHTVTLAPWSVAFYVNEDWSHPVYDTSVAPKSQGTIRDEMVAADGNEFQWQWWAEPCGPSQVPSAQPVVAAQPLEQLSLTHDRSDYLWYETNFTIYLENVRPRLMLADEHDLVHVFADHEYAGSAQGPMCDLTLPEMTRGVHLLSILCTGMGLQNYGLHLESLSLGLLGTATIDGRDIRKGTWSHLAALQGERAEIWTDTGAQRVTWRDDINATAGRALTWFHTRPFTLPTGAPRAVYYLEMTGMGRGYAFVNGRRLGRDWPAKIGDSGEACKRCSYKGTYSPGSECRVNCGMPTQSAYFVPASWLHLGDGIANTLTIWEEQGGAIGRVQLVTL